MSPSAAPARHRRRTAVTFGTAATFALAATALPAGAAAAAGSTPQTVTFGFTGAPATWTVPADVFAITVDMYGGAGAPALAPMPVPALRSTAAQAGASGGAGDEVKATIAVTPGEQLQIDVGGAGAGQDQNDPTLADHGAGGWNGGADGGDYAGSGQAGTAGGGGGASDVRRGSALSDRLLVAAGGGGAGAAGEDVYFNEWMTGGAGGAGADSSMATGGDGADGTTGASTPAGEQPPTGGKGGASASQTAAAGGKTGTNQTAYADRTNPDGLPGAPGAGGTGAGTTAIEMPCGGAGGGGGGGWVGGGGGGAGGAGYVTSCAGGAGGGAGSDYIAGNATGTTLQRGVRSGNGEVVISYLPASPPSARTGAASDVTAHTATVAGAVNPEGLAGTYHFEYGTTSSYGATTPAVAAGSGSASTDVTAALKGLTAGTTYHYRVVIETAAGTARGADETFTTTTPSVSPSPSASPTPTASPSPSPSPAADQLPRTGAPAGPAAIFGFGLLALGVVLIGAGRSRLSRIRG